MTARERFIIVPGPEMCREPIDGECKVARSGTHSCFLPPPHERHRCGCGYWEPKAEAKS